jgi:hypothetical protein
MWNNDDDFSKKLFLSPDIKLTRMNDSMLAIIQPDILKLENKYEIYPNEEVNTNESLTEEKQPIEKTNNSINPLLLLTGYWKKNKYYNIHDVVYVHENRMQFECIVPHKSDIFITDWLVKDYWQEIIQIDMQKTIQNQEEFMKKMKKEKSSKRNKKSRKVFIFDEKK